MARDKEKERARHREYHAKHRDNRRKQHRNWRYLKHYNLTSDQVHFLSEIQEHRCPICSIEFYGQKVCVDHDHDTGLVRAVLCDSCNRGIGLLGDDPERIKAAAAYLEWNKARNT